MKFIQLIAFALLVTACSSTRVVPDYGRPLPPGAAALLPLDADDPRPVLGETWKLRDELLPSLDLSIRWTQKQYAQQFFPMAGITHERALQSLVRFRELLLESTDPVAFHNAVYREFSAYKSAGWDAQGGGVLFTAYCTPILDGRMQPDEKFNIPLYGLPPDLEKGPDGAILGQRTDAGLKPYPARAAIEASGMLAGKNLELAYLGDPLDAFIAHVNGSAFVRLESGELYRLGYAGKNGREYTSLGLALVADGKLDADTVSLASIRTWAGRHPEQVDEYLNRNESYVFFTPIGGNPRGSLNVEVARTRSLATDKTLFPRGALTFIDTKVPTARGNLRPYRQMMLDQDTGGAIRTAGRADLYLGVGPDAERLSGATRAEGQLYYFFLAE